MKKYILLSLFVGLSLYAHTQTIQKFTVYFDVDKHTLKQESVAELDKIIALYNTQYITEITLTAHTDKDASDAYNLQLSQRRSNSVTEYLKSQNIRHNLLSAHWHGEQHPAVSNETAAGKKQNRRVEITVEHKPFTTASEILTTLKDNQQLFTLPTNGSYTIIAKNGSEVTIPKDAFTDAQGHKIPNKGVIIAIDEALSAADGLTNELVTETTEGNMLESGGMIKITASFSSKELFIASGKQLTVDLPSDVIKEGMTVFNGSFSSDGLVRWNDTKTKFSVGKQNVKEAPLLLNTQIFQKFVKPIPNIQSLTLDKLELTFPEPPKHPIKPRPPYKPKEIKAENAVTGIASWFTSESRKKELAAQQNAQKQEIYLQKYAQYEAKMANYHEAVKQYEQAFSKYEGDLDDINIAIDKHLETLENEHKRYKVGYDQFRLNYAITYITAKNKEAKYTALNPETYIRRVAQSNTHYEGKDLLTFLSNQIGYYQMISRFDAHYIANHFVKDGKISVALIRKHWGKRNEHWFHDPKFSLHHNQLCDDMLNDQEVQDMIEAAVDKKLAEDTKNGIVSQGGLDRYFRAGVSNLGWINCDRFPAELKKVVTSLAVLGVAGERVMVFVKKLKSLLNVGINKENGYVSLPEMEEAKAIHITAINGKPQLSIVPFIAHKKTHITPQYKEVTLSEMKNLLAAL